MFDVEMEKPLSLKMSVELSEDIPSDSKEQETELSTLFKLKKSKLSKRHSLLNVPTSSVAC